MEEAIKKNRPDITASSLRTYMCLLRGLYYISHPKGSEVDMHWFHNSKAVMEALEKRPITTRKTTSASLIALLGDQHSKSYRDLMMEDRTKYEKIINEQKMSPKQETNWEEYAVIKQKVEEIYERVKPLLALKELTQKQFHMVRDFILLALTSGYYIPPRRSQDWAAMLNARSKLDKNEHNYILKNEFVFNKYKTAKSYATQKVEIPKELKSILTKWMKLNPYDYLIVNNQGGQVDSVRISQILNRIFGKAISTSMLRHIFISDRLKDIPALKDLQTMAADMGHSVEEQLQYIKHK